MITRPALKHARSLLITDAAVIVCFVLSKRLYQNQCIKSTKQDLQGHTWLLIMFFSLHFSFRRSCTIFSYRLISSILGMKILTMCLRAIEVDANLTLINQKS